MRDFLVKIISIILAIISVIILLIFLQNVFYNGNPFIVFNQRFVIMEKDYNEGQIKKDDLIIINENNTTNLKNNTIIAYLTEQRKVALAKIENINEDNSISILTDEKDTLLLSKKDLLGTYEMKIPAVGSCILYLRTLKGFLISIGVVFVILLIITSLSKIVLFIKKLFTKKY